MVLSKAINRSKTLVIVIPFIFASCDEARKQSSEPTNTVVETSDSIVELPMLDSLIVEPEQFVKKQVLTAKDLYRDYDGGDELSKFFLIELIDRNTFQTNRSHAVDFLTVDTTLYHKQKGVLKLPMQRGELELKDNLADNETHKEYTYLGQIKPLNMYLISGSYWEDWAYMLFDKKNGDMVQSFIGIPYLSADKQYMVSMDIDSFDGVASIALYAVTSDPTTSRMYVDPVVEMYIKSWIPLTVKDNMYWSTDGYLYMPVVSNSNYWAADNNFYGLDQYIRLKPVA